jgi:hypothetical protein
MSVVYANTVKDNRLNVVNDAVNSKTYAAGTGAGSAGTLVIGTASLNGTASDATAKIVAITLQNPAFTESGQVLTLAGVTLSGTASLAGTNTAAKAEIRNNAGTVIVSGLTVGTSGTDIIINSTSITSGQTVQVTSGTITHG